MKYSILFSVALIATVSAAPWCSCNPCGWITGGNVGKPKCSLSRETCSGTDSTEGENECYSSDATYECDCMINEVIGYVEPTTTTTTTSPPETTTAIADWGLSFDAEGWSEVPEGTLITGLDRSGSMSDGSSYGIFHIERATYVSSIYNDGCTVEDWWGTWDVANAWVMCPAGSAIKGLYRTLGDSRLYNVEQGRCCPGVEENNCMEVDVSLSLDSSGLSSCPEGYALNGMWRSTCDELHCIETFKCCQVLTPTTTTTEMLTTTTTTVACPGPYKTLDPITNACIFNCGMGTSPSSGTDECTCNPGYTETNADTLGRRQCVYQPPTTTSAASNGHCTCNSCGYITKTSDHGKMQCAVARTGCSSSTTPQTHSDCYSSHPDYACDCMIDQIVQTTTTTTANEASCTGAHRMWDSMMNYCNWNCGMGTEPNTNMNECTCVQGYTETNTDTLGRRQCVYQPPATTSTASNIPWCSCNPCGWVTGSGEHGQMNCDVARETCSSSTPYVQGSSECYSSHADYQCDCMINQVVGYVAPTTTTTTQNEASCMGQYRSWDSAMNYCNWNCPQNAEPDYAMNTCRCMSGYTSSYDSQNLLQCAYHQPSTTTASNIPWCSCNPCGWVTGSSEHGQMNCDVARDSCSSSTPYVQGSSECYSSHADYQCDCMINQVVGYVASTTTTTTQNADSCTGEYRSWDPAMNSCNWNCPQNAEADYAMNTCRCMPGYTNSYDSQNRLQCAYHQPSTTTASNIPWCSCNPCGMITGSSEHGQMNCDVARETCSASTPYNSGSNECYSSHDDYQCDCMINQVVGYVSSTTTTTTQESCVDVNHINDNPGFYTCDCVDPADPCLSHGQCVAEAACPSSHGQPIATTTTTQNACPGAYRIQQGSACVWSCAQGTTPDQATNQCVCQPNHIETHLDIHGRRVCAEQTSTAIETTTTTTTSAPLTACANTDDSSSVYEQLEEVFCLCDEYRTDGWTWARNELSDPLANKIRALRDVHVPHNPKARKFLRSWKRRLGFGAHLHGKVSQNKRERFYHKRMWRKVCLSMGRTRPMLRRVARRIDAINSNN